MNHRTILQEISILALPGLHIGHAQNTTAKTGVTVLLFDHGARVGIDISGGERLPEKPLLPTLKPPTIQSMPSYCPVVPLTVSPLQRVSCAIWKNTELATLPDLQMFP